MKMQNKLKIKAGASQFVHFYAGANVVNIDVTGL